ncbi:reticulocyte-binding protein 2 [Plasmodium vivax Mauritania I]|uniref:Reticulocyte-binding protein 2 n=1 Tax=Plasmodium vivax Mauritania I TaxID=1035515 RepID=A0A0J9TGQ8_PLAVI|nr:reticulocyte-binding protein 2 [Plasmodium vivax Mauritania I]
MRNGQHKYNNAKTEDNIGNQINNDNNHNGYNDNRINSEYPKTSHLQHSPSLVHLNDHKFTTKPSRHSYVQRNSIYKRNTNNNMENTNNELHVVPNFFIQEKKAAPQKPSVQNTPTATQIVYNNLDYLNAFDDTNNIISAFKPHHPIIYYFKELEHFANSYYDLRSKIKDYFAIPMKQASDVVEKNVKDCLQNINESRILMTQLENPQNYNDISDKYDEKVKEYKKKIEDMQICLKDNYIKNFKAIMSANLKMNLALNGIYIHWWYLTCSTETYYDIVKEYVKEINDFDEKKSISFMDNMKKIHKSAIDTLKKMKAELNTSLDSKRTEFIIGEIGHMIEKFNLHLTKIRYASAFIKSIPSQKVESDIYRVELKTLFYVAAKHYADFKFSLEHLKMFDNLSKSKKEMLYSTFDKLEGELKNKIKSVMDSEQSTSDLNTVIADSEKKIESAELLINSSSEQIAQYALDSNEKINEIKTNYEQKILKVKEFINQSKELITSAKGTSQLSESDKQEIQKKIDAVKTKTDVLERGKEFINIMNEIKKKKKSNSSNSATNSKAFSDKLKELQTEFEGLNKTIEDDLQKINEIKIKENEDRSMKDQIEQHLKDASDNSEKVKRLISKNNEIQKYIQIIENLIKDAPSGKEKFTTQKTDLQNKVKTIIDEFHKEDLQLLLNSLSTFYEEHQKLYNEASTIEKIKDLHQKTKEEYEKLEKMKFSNFGQILDKLNTELDNLKTLEKNIVEEQTNNINKDMTDSLNKLTAEVNSLRSALDSYKADEGQLKTYKNQINERKKNFLSTLKEKEDDIPDGKNIYEEYNNHKGVMVNKAHNITSDINQCRENIINAKKNIETFNTLVQTLEAHTGKTYPDAHTSLQKLKSNLENLNLSELENEFKSLFDSASTTNKQIENIRKNIDTIKSLNFTKNSSDRSKVSLENIIKNKADLIKKLDQHTQEIEKYTFIEKGEKSPLLSDLKEEKNRVESDMSEELINQLNTKINDILEYYDKSKDSFNGDDEKKLEQLDDFKRKCQDVQQGIEKLTTNYKVLENRINDIIKKQHEKVITMTENHITGKDKKINEKIQQNVNSLNEMKAKLGLLEINEDIKNSKDVTIKNKIQEFENKVKTILGNIGNANNKIDAIKRVHDANKVEFDREKVKKTSFDEKKEIIGKVYQQMEKTLKELEEMDDESSITKDVDVAQILYRRIFINHAVNLMDDEVEKSKTVMAEIELYKKEIDETKQKTIEYKQGDTSNFDYTKEYNNATQSKAKIENFIENVKTKKGTSDTSQNIKELESIKEEVHDNLQQVKLENVSMEEIRKQILNMKNLLISNNSETIAKEISNNTQNALGFRDNAKTELNKTNELLQSVEAKIAEAEAHKKKIGIALEDGQIDTEVSEIEQIKREIINKKNEIESYLNEIKEYKDKCTTEISNSKRGKDKIEFLEKFKPNEESNSNKVNINEINENIRNSEQYLKDIEDAEKQASTKVELFHKHETTISNIFKESEILGVETKSQKKINKAEDIMKEIERHNSEIQTKVNDFQENLDKLNEPHNYDDAEVELNNDKSTNAKVLIETNLESVKHNLSEITNIKQGGEKIYSKAKDIMQKIKATSENTAEKTLEKVKDDQSNYVNYLNQITTERNLIVTEKNRLNGIDSTITNIEGALKESKKNYEIGFLEKLEEIGKNRKLKVDITKKSINSTVGNFSSLFNNFDLNQYDFNKNINDYENKMGEIYNEFEGSLNKISENLRNASENTSDYNSAKTLRLEAQKEKVNLLNKEEEANKYLRDVKKVESFRFIFNMKESLDKINEMIKKEQLTVNEGHGNVKQLVENIKELVDENNLSDILKQATGKNEEIQKITHSTLKNKAKTILGHVDTSAKYVGIKITPELALTELLGDAKLKTAQELKFESKNNVVLETENMSKNTNELDVHKNIQDAYKVALEILAHSDEIDTKQKDSSKLIEMGNQIYLKVVLINQYKNKISSIKSKEEAVSVKIGNVSKKHSELSKITCSDKSYDNIIALEKQTELQNLRNSFTQEKTNTNSDSKLEKIKTDFESLKNALKTLEGEVNALKASSDNHEHVQSKSEPVNAALSEIEKEETDIDSLNTALDELLKKGRTCEVSRYKLIKDTVTKEISDDTELINTIEKNVKAYLAYIKKNYEDTVQDVLTLNEHFNTKQVSDHEPTNFDKSNKSSEELTKAVTDSKTIISKLKGVIIEVNENTEMNTIESSAKEIEALYNELKNKKTSLNEIYQTSNEVKLQEMKSNADKYIDVSKIFNTVLDTQKSNIVTNQHSINNVKDKLKGKLQELIDADSSFTLESIKKFNEIYSHIKTNIGELEQLQQTNKSEHDNVAKHKEKIVHLINRVESLKGDVKNHDDDQYMKKLNASLLNDNIKNTTNSINISDEELKKLLKKVEENDQLCKNNNTQNFISDIMKRVEDLNRRFTENLPEKEKLHQIENNYNEISSIFSEINLQDVDEFVAKIHKQIDAEKASVNNVREAEKIRTAIQNVTSYDTEIISRLSEMNNVLERITTRKTKMDQLLKSLSPDNTSLNLNARTHVRKSEDIIKQLNSHIEKITELNTYAHEVMTYLENELNKLLKQLEIERAKLETKTSPSGMKAKEEKVPPKETENQNSVQDNLASVPQKTLEDNTHQMPENRVQEDSISAPQEQVEYSTLAVPENDETTEEESEHDDAHDDTHDESQTGRDSTAKEAIGKTRLAGAVIIAMSVLSGFIIIVFKDKDEEEKDHNEHGYNEAFGEHDEYNMHDKEEVIEVCFNEED